MKPYPNPSHAGVERTVDEMVNLRSEDMRNHRQLLQSKLDGRERTGIRVVPSSATDVIVGDNVGDKLQDGTYCYQLINDSGTLKWDRRSLNTSW